MTLYFNKETGDYIEAEQWDGTDDHLAEISKKLDVALSVGFPMTKDCFISADDGLFLVWDQEGFINTHFPFTEARKRLLDVSLPIIRQELSKKMKKGDGWLKESIHELLRWTDEESNEVYDEGVKVVAGERNFEQMQAEGAHLAICAMFLIDKAESLKAEHELKEMWNSTSKTDS